MIVIVFGLPGSGKSFFASILAKKIGAEYINSDQLRKQMFRKRTYSSEDKEKVYNAIFDLSKMANINNANLVIDATFYKQNFRQRYLDEMNEDVLFIEVITTRPIVKKRLSQPRAFSEADFKAYKKIKKEWEPFEQKHLVLDSTNDNIGEMMSKAALYLHVNA